MTLACLSGIARAGDLTVIVKDLSNQPLRDAVVYADIAAGAAPVPPQSVRATIDQVNRQFVPLVTVLRTGTEVRFPNSDNIRHSIYSFSSAKTFTTKLYSGQQAPPLVFDKPGLVVLGCNIHDSMVAWVVVLDTPFFGKSGADGTVTLKGLDPGEYRLSVWYPGPKFEPTVTPIQVQSDDLHREVSVDASASPLPALRARAASPSAFKP